jgi:hypothetical protein
LIRYKIQALCIKLALSLSYKGFVQDLLIDAYEAINVEILWYKGLK